GGLFDAYIVNPCLPEALVEAVQSVTTSPSPRQDLLIISRERIGIYDVMRRFGGSTARVEVRRDLRLEERRRASDAGTPEDRRRRDRRARDVTEQLRADGWAFVAAAERS